MLADSEVHRALVVTAHPDDVDSARGRPWRLGGNKASRSRTASSPMEMPEVLTPPCPRANSEHPPAEQTAAAAACGVTDVRFLGYRDGELTVSHRPLRHLA